MNFSNNFVEFSFILIFFINALVFIPQALQILKQRSATTISIATFSGLLLIQFSLTLYGAFIGNLILALGCILSVLAVGAILGLAIYYKRPQYAAASVLASEILDQLPCHIYWKDKNGVLLGSNKRNFEDFNLVTQNVDNLHTIAGSKSIIELHGNITRNRCTGCDDMTIVNKDDVIEEIPKCSKCGSPLKPDIILFGEELNQKVLRKAQEISAVCEVFISIGTSSLVEPAASLPYVAKGNGAYLLEINTERTPLSDNCDEVIIAPAAKLLTNLVMILDRLR